MGRAALLSLLMLLAVVAPICLNWVKKPNDSFPLSHYPMFSHERQGKAQLTHLVGVGVDGTRQYLPYQLAGTGGMNQVRKVIAKRAKKDPDGLCQTVAQAIAQDTLSWQQTQTVKVVRSEFLFDRFFAGDQTPQSSAVLCSCAVKRDAIAQR